MPCQEGPVWESHYLFFKVRWVFADLKWVNQASRFTVFEIWRQKGTSGEGVPKTCLHWGIRCFNIIITQRCSGWQLRKTCHTKKWSLINNSFKTNIPEYEKRIPCWSELLFSYQGMSDSLWPHGLQHPRLPCPSPSPRICSNSYPPSQWCHPTISSSVIPFSSCLQSFPASGSFPMSWLFASGGQELTHEKQVKLKISWTSSPNRCSGNIDVNNTSLLMSIINSNIKLVWKPFSPSLLSLECMACLWPLTCAGSYDLW